MTAGPSAPDGSSGAHFIPLPRSSEPVPSLPWDAARLPASISIEDWNDLFSAVRTRLELAAGTLPARAQANDGVLRVRTGMLECVEALGQLHDMLGQERERCHRLELEIFDLRTALALALSELVEWHRPVPVAGSETRVTNGV